MDTHRALLPLGLVGMIALPAGAQTLSGQDYFPLASGNSWSYQFSSGGTATVTVQSGTTTVNGVQTKALLYDDGSTEYYTSDALGIREHGLLTSELDSIAAFSPPFTVLGGAAGVGDSASYTGSTQLAISGIGSFSADLTGSSEVVGFEILTVPAGTFTALKSRMSLTMTVPSLGISTTAQDTSWLVEGLGLVKDDNTTDGEREISELSSTSLPLRDVALAVAASAASVEQGGAYAYTLTVTNHSGSAASALEVVATLPSGITFVGASGTGWSCVPALPQVTCSKATLNGLAAEAITLSVAAPLSGEGALSAAFAVTAAEVDNDVRNNDTQSDLTLTARQLAVLDVDGDGDADANDGVMIQRRLTGAGTVTTNVLLPQGVGGSGGGGARDNGEVVAAIDGVAILLDVDGDGDADANDGVMIQRRLTGAGTVQTNIALPTGVGGSGSGGALTNQEIVARIDALTTP